MRLSLGIILPLNGPATPSVTSSAPGGVFALIRQMASSMASLRLTIAVAIVIRLSGLSLEASKGPPKARNNILEHRVRVGGLVRLSCSVDSDMSLIVEWTKDGRPIHPGWTRFRVSEQDHGLRIRNATLGDRGSYVCKAANGFGSIDIHHTVHIEWTHLIPNADKSPNYLRPSVGDSVSLHCPRSNKFRPSFVTWYKDGDDLSLQGRAEETNVTNDFSLTLNDVTIEDSGVYECRVRQGPMENDATNTIVIDVIEDSRKPTFVRPPQNVSVALAGTATFYCQVRSDNPSHIQWLRRVEGTPDGGDASTGIIRIDDSRFLAINGTQFVYLSDESYLSKLMIRNVRQSDVGFYICTCSNTHGYLTGGAYLTILPTDVRNYANTATSHQQDSAFPSLIVVLSVLAILFIFCSLSLVVYRSHFSAKSAMINGGHSTVDSNCRLAAPQADLRRACPLATPDSSRRLEHHYVTVASSLERENCCSVPCEPCNPVVVTFGHFTRPPPALGQRTQRTFHHQTSGVTLG